MPGLVNAHTHVAMSLLRGLADDLRLDVWLMGYMMPVEREFVSPEFVRLGTRLGCAEMIRSGITCFADMYYFEDAVAEATAEVGMRALCGQTVLRFPAPDARSYEEGLARAREFIERWKGHPLIVPAPAPHAPYTCTPEILRSCAELAAEFDVPLHIHLSETLLEVEESRRAHGMPGVPYVRKQGLFDAKVLAAHCVHVDEGEIRALKNFGAGVAHNPTQQPEAGRRHRPGRADAGARRQRRHRHRRRRVEQRPRHVRGDAAGRAPGQGHHRRSDRGPGAGRAGDGDTARRGGAAHGHLTGSLEAGKRADLIVLDVSRLHDVPAFARDPGGIYARIVYTSKSTDVVDVMCNGRWLMRDRSLQTIDEDEVMREAADRARRIDAFLGSREVSVLQKLVAVGGAVEQESFEVQVKAAASPPTPGARGARRRAS